MSNRKILGRTALFTFIISFLMLNVVAAAPRGELLASFISENQNSTGAFEDRDIDILEYDDIFASYAAVSMLDELSQMGVIDEEKANNYFEDEYDIVIEAGSFIDMYYTVAGAKLTGTFSNDSKIEDGVNLIKDNQTADYGFTDLANTSSNLVDTYYAILFLDQANSLDEVSAANISDFVISCWLENQGFSGTPGGSEASIINNYYAVKILEKIDQLSALSPTKLFLLKNNAESYYVNNTGYPNHYGGYSYDQDLPYASILLTYYCVSIQSVLGGTLHTSDTINFLLSRQNSNDFGFQDLNEQVSQGKSSISSSYYAFESLLILSSDPIEEIFNEDVWGLETNPWVVAGIVAAVIGGIVVIGLLINKYRTKI